MGRNTMRNSINTAMRQRNLSEYLKDKKVMTTIKNGVQENNKIIAEFMGCEIGFADTSEPCIMGKQNAWTPLKYHSDWNWLMEVVEKIKSLVCESEFTNRIGLKLNNLNKDAVYNACVEFIKWYNQNSVS